MSAIISNTVSAEAYVLTLTEKFAPCCSYNIPHQRQHTSCLYNAGNFCQRGICNKIYSTVFYGDIQESSVLDGRVSGRLFTSFIFTSISRLYINFNVFYFYTSWKLSYKAYITIPTVSFNLCKTCFVRIINTYKGKNILNLPYQRILTLIVTLTLALV